MVRFLANRRTKYVKKSLAQSPMDSKRIIDIVNTDGTPQTVEVPAPPVPAPQPTAPSIQTDPDSLANIEEDKKQL